MRGRKEQRIEAAVDHVAAALFGSAAGWTALTLLNGMLGGSPLWAAAAGAAFLGYVLSVQILRRVPPLAPTYELRCFTPRDLELEADELLLTEQVELVLTEADRLQAPSNDLLVLDDILSELTPDSRVVRLFDPAAMPSPAQLNARIEQHLGREATPAGHPDAAQALHDALAELRRSLR